MKLKKFHTVSARDGHFFSNRVVNALNSLTDSVILSPTVAALNINYRRLTSIYPPFNILFIFLPLKYLHFCLLCVRAHVSGCSYPFVSCSVQFAVITPSPMGPIHGDGLLFLIDFFVCLYLGLFISLLVSLSATLRANRWTDLHEITGKVWSDHHLITFLANSEKPRDAAMRNTGTGFVVLSHHSSYCIYFCSYVPNKLSVSVQTGRRLDLSA